LAGRLSSSLRSAAIRGPSVSFSLQSAGVDNCRTRATPPHSPTTYTCSPLPGCSLACPSSQATMRVSVGQAQSTAVLLA
jgi:hypothetical protein